MISIILYSIISAITIAFLLIECPMEVIPVIIGLTILFISLFGWIYSIVAYIRLNLGVAAVQVQLGLTTETLQQLLAMQLEAQNESTEQIEEDNENS